MHIIIKYTKLDSTPAIDLYIREKIGSLSKFIGGMDKKGTVEIHIEIARTTKHHKKGAIFCAKGLMELPGKNLRAEHNDWNVRRAISELKSELQQELKKYSVRFRPQDSRGQEELRKLRGK